MGKTIKIKNEKEKNSEKLSDVKLPKVKIHWGWWALLGFVVAFLIFYKLFSGLGTFTYEGLSFNIEKYEKFNIYHYSYYFVYNGETYKNNVYFRIDPRKNDVPVNATILFKNGKSILASIDGPSLAGCQDSTIPVATLAQFFGNNFFNVTYGTTSREEADERNQTYITCNEYPDKTVVLLQGADETSIAQAGENCYHINVNQCQLQEAVEKFVIRSIIDARTN